MRTSSSSFSTNNNWNALGQEEVSGLQSPNGRQIIHTLAHQNFTVMLGELTKEEIESILTTNVIGRLGCCAQQKIFVVPVTYTYDGEYIIGNTVEGMKISLLRQNPQCCFEVDVIENLANWKSVIAWGTFEELKGEDAEKALEKLINKVEPLMPGETVQPPRMGASSSQRTSTFRKNFITYRIRLTEKSGRYERH